MKSAVETIKSRGAILTVFAFAVHTAAANVVAWYHFDEVAPGNRLVADDTILNAVDSTKLPGKPYSVTRTGTSGDVFVNFGNDPDFMPIATNDAPDSIWVIDPVGGTTNRNERSLYFRYADEDTLDKPARYGGCVKVESDSSLSLPNLTVECLVRPERLTPRTNNGWTLVSKQTHADKGFTYSINVYQDGKPYVNIGNSSGEILATTGHGNLEGSKSILDGKWHHLALTVSGTTVKLYVDYYCEKTVTLSSGLYYVDDGPLYIGACKTVYKPGGFIDEVRISDEALATTSFLRFFNTTASFHAGFENTLNADVLRGSPSLGVGTAGRAAEEFRYPSFTNDLPNARVVNGGGKVVRKANRGALYLEGGQVKYPHNADLETNEMTVECFMKYKGGTNYGNVLRFNQATNDWGATPIWSVYFQDGQLKMRVDRAERVKSFGSTFCDGEWHHLGIAFKQFASGISVSVYDNYQQVGGGWYFEDNRRLKYDSGSCLGVGTGPSPNYYFAGYVDELRISQGVLPVEYFMRGARRPGFAVIIR